MAEGAQAPAQWAPDPYGRHRYRFWDGERWTDRVADGATPPPAAVGARDTVRAVRGAPDTVVAADLRPDADAGPPPQPAPARPRNVLQLPLPWRTHVALTIVSLGLWLLALPALQLWRRQRREGAVLWGIAAVVAVVLGGVMVAVQSGSGDVRRVVVLPDDAVAAPETTSRTASGATARTTSGRISATRSVSTRPAPTTSSAKRTKTTRTRTTRTTLDPRFLTCLQATAAGYGPYRRGVDPEYYWYWDFDGDGVVCD